MKIPSKLKCHLCLTPATLVQGMCFEVAYLAWRAGDQAVCTVLSTLGRPASLSLQGTASPYPVLPSLSHWLLRWACRSIAVCVLMVLRYEGLVWSTIYSSLIRQNYMIRSLEWLWIRSESGPCESPAEGRCTRNHNSSILQRRVTCASLKLKSFKRRRALDR